VVLTNKYYNGVVPSPNEFSEVDEQTLAELKAYPAVISSSIERYRFREALGELMNVARLGNKYLADEEPWKMVKENPTCKNPNVCSITNCFCFGDFIGTVFAIHPKN
jgi:methionyl-tRNA synthetase